MRKEWKYRLSCGFLALTMAGVQPALVYAVQDHTAEAQEALSEEDSAAQNQETSSDTENALQSQENLPEEAPEGEGDFTTEEQIDAYFDGAVFVGDSVMVGYSNYAMRRGGPCLGRMQFLAAVSFSAFNALRPVTAKSTHPLYQGQ